VGGMSFHDEPTYRMKGGKYFLSFGLHWKHILSPWISTKARKGRVKRSLDILDDEFAEKDQGHDKKVINDFGVIFGARCRDLSSK